MDFTIGSKAAGRVVFELYTDITPKTDENFRGYALESTDRQNFQGKNFII